jgi:hypothetical protein
MVAQSTGQIETTNEEDRRRETEKKRKKRKEKKERKQISHQHELTSRPNLPKKMQKGDHVLYTVFPFMYFSFSTSFFHRRLCSSSSSYHRYQRMIRFAHQIIADR